MEIRILGPVRVVHDGLCFDITRHQARAVLARLALEPGRPVSFDRLAEDVWPDAPGRRNAMQAAVSRLRRALVSVPGGAEAIRTVRDGYVLDVRESDVDARRFLALADRGSDLVGHRPAEAKATLTEALRLWDGPVLSDVDDVLPFRIEAAHLGERWLTATEDLAAARLGLGEGQSLLEQLRRLAAEHPQRERFTEQLMTVLYRGGRQGEALEAFHATRRHLASELGVSPGPGMHGVYEAILGHDRALG